MGSQHVSFRLGARLAASGEAFTLQASQKGHPEILVPHVIMIVAAQITTRTRVGNLSIQWGNHVHVE